jgi:tetratricopeptide (TPR) repeat protein
MRITIALALLPVVASAEPRQDADAHARRGVALYNLGKFEDAIGEFERAYELFQSDALLFNLAQAHRKLDHCDRALHYYNEFLAGRPAPALAAQVEELMPKLEAACRTKDEPPTAPAAAAPTPEPMRTAAVTPEVPEAPPPPVVETPTFAVTASGTVGGVISNGTAPATGVRAAVTFPVSGVAIGGAVGVGELWRGADDQNAMTAQVVARVQYRASIGWARWTAAGELGAAYYSLLANSSGVVPGIGLAGQWAPLARGELGAEHDVAPSWAVTAALAIGASPRVGALDAAIGTVDLVVGVRYER